MNFIMRSKNTRPWAILSVALSLALLLSFTAPVGVAGVERNGGTDTAGQTTSTTTDEPAEICEKDEIIYGKLAADGTVEQLYIVNAFDRDKPGEIIDYGKYEEVQNLTSTQPIEYQDGTVRARCDAGLFYYQGDLVSKESPWNIKLTYKLNGRPVNPADLSGENGALEIKLKIEPNQQVDPVYAEHFLLQISLTADMNKMSDLTADGALIANSGGNKLITWVVLPGDSADYTLTADIRNFSMSGLQIGGVPLNMDFELPSLDQYTDDFSQLNDGIAELNSGAQKLQEGIDALSDGAAASASGAGELADNGALLTDGLREIRSGLSQYGAGVGAYAAGVEQLSGGSEQVLGGLRELSGGLRQLSSQNSSLTDGSKQIGDALNSLSAALSGTKQSAPNENDLAKLGELVNGSQAFYDGLKQLSDGLGATVGPMKEATTGLRAISDGLSSSTGGLGELTAGLKAANDGLKGTTDNLQQIPPALSADQVIAQLGGLDDPSSADSQKLLYYIETSANSTNAQLTALANGLSELHGNYQALHTNFETVAGALGDLSTGLSETCDGLEQIVQQQEMIHTQLVNLAEQYAQINTGIGALAQSTGNLPQLIDGVNQLAAQYREFDAGLSAYTLGVSQTSAGAAELSQGMSSLDDGLDRLAVSGGSLRTAAEALAGGAGGAAEGTGTYVGGVRRLADGLAEYSDGMEQYASGVKELAVGTQTLDDETKDMDKKLEERLKEEIDKLIGGEFEIRSFASPRNTEIRSVQFVFMTAEIPEPAKQEAVAPVEERRSFWQKLSDLFK